MPLKTTISPAIPARQNELPTSEGRWRRRGDGPDDEHRCCICPCHFSSCLWMTLLVSDLALATRVMREAVEQGGSLPVCLSICVQRAALKTPPPFGRTLSSQESAARLSRGADSCPQASCGPLPQIPSSRLGSGSRRHTLRASMYRRQRTNQKKRS